MVEKKVQKTEVQSDQLSDSDTPDEEVDPQLRMSEEERIYRMIKYKSVEQSDGGKRPTEVTQNEETLQRMGS